MLTHPVLGQLEELKHGFPITQLFVFRKASLKV